MNYITVINSLSEAERSEEVRKLYAVHCNDYDSPRAFSKYLSCSVPEAEQLIQEGRLQNDRKIQFGKSSTKD